MKRNRKRIFVDKHVQGAIVARLAVYWLAASTMALSLSVVFQSLSDPLTPFQEHLRRAGAAAVPVLTAFLFVLPMVLLDMTRMTNRFAGPILRLKRSLQQLRAGEFQGTLKFRDKDYWSDLADEFNLLATEFEKLRSAGPVDRPSGAPAVESDEQLAGV